MLVKPSSFQSSHHALSFSFEVFNFLNIPDDFGFRNRALKDSIKVLPPVYNFLLYLDILLT